MTDLHADAPGPIAAGSLAAELRKACASNWDAYVNHPFVRQLAAGTLETASYKHFLIQDYLFLRHFARAWMLVAYKAPDLNEMRAASQTVDALINQELQLHVETCAGWGISEAEMAATPEARANLAYTRFVLETGHSGDLLDLLVALAPCVVGYGEIGARLAADPATVWDGNPFREWLDLYSDEEFQEVGRGACAQIDRVARARIGSDVTGSPRWSELCRIFGQATRLEIGFWDMGLNRED
ncbi:TenA family protein [Rhodovibrio salinarum]|uniref:Thiaminase II n=1 Tax=Rhodovibrio salinarum TaxID=1087 RepID=A0A934QJK3_9PROT|nr:TenA family protein [Rhodovibrio salinarum]MBK1697620.1 thiaminase II [Rhodovibrio salinarum]